MAEVLKLLGSSLFASRLVAVMAGRCRSRLGAINLRPSVWSWRRWRWPRSGMARGDALAAAAACLGSFAANHYSLAS
jgi:hypothetical protein